MSTAAIVSTGIKVTRGVAHVQIAELLDVTWGGKTRTAVDVTDIDAPNGYREFKGGLRNAGELTFNLLFTRDGWNDINDDYEDDTAQTYQIVMPDTGDTTFEFSGLVTALGINSPMDDKVQCPVTIKISGQPTMTS